MGWDHHGNLPNAIRGQCMDTDQASAALIQDLKAARPAWTTPWSSGAGSSAARSIRRARLTATDYGRDHHPRCFSLYMTGAGIKRGMTLGETDDYCYNITKDPVSVHDLHATMLHLLGVDHTRLTFRYQGRDFRLTDVSGELVHAIMA